MTVDGVMYRQKPRRQRSFLRLDSAWNFSFSVVQILSSLGKLILTALRVTGSRVQVLVAQDLCQTD
jgi:hypothetical protein